ncbi:hypothetical protein KAI87_15295, partial [Myxococcota bacterium]|nr:hypothetical protein [Myxococcota bacterium]
MAVMRKVQTLTIIVAGLLATSNLIIGCNSATSSQRDPGSVGGGEDLPDEGLELFDVTTQVQVNEIQAGASLSVSCLASRNSEPDPSLAVELIVEPSAASQSSSSAIFELSFDVATRYQIRCSLSDYERSDPEGVWVTVLPGEITRVETTVDVLIAHAGAPVAVDCELLDAYGNINSDDKPGPLVVTDGISSERSIHADFMARGTAPGLYDLTCTYGELQDSTPASIEIIAGSPGRSETSVDSSAISPLQSAAVSCNVFDDYGNPLPDAESSFVVMSADGTPLDSTGYTSDESCFSATRAGTYYVFCTVPGHSAGDESPAVVTVHPGGACTWLWEMPEVDCFLHGRLLPFTYDVFDFWGNTVTDTHLLVSPMANADLARGGFVFPDDGIYDLSIGVDPDFRDVACDGVEGGVADSGGQMIAGVRNIRVDSTPPSLYATSPARAEMVVAGDATDYTQAIAGEAVDDVSPITSLIVEGQDFAPDGTQTLESFSFDQTSRWGLSIIRGFAEDECG